ncbi:MAG: DoxX family protein [Ginsengibacter sp.]
MRALLSSKHSAGAINAALFILRVGFAILIIKHGYQKLSHFESMQHQFINFLGLGATVSLVLTIFAEFFCGMLLVLGLFTRFACIPLIVTMCVALVKAHNMDVFGKGEAAFLFLLGFIAILLAGPGKASLDSVLNK